STPACPGHRSPGSARSECDPVAHAARVRRPRLVPRARLARLPRPRLPRSRRRDRPPQGRKAHAGRGEVQRGAVRQLSARRPRGAGRRGRARRGRRAARLVAARAAAPLHHPRRVAVVSDARSKLRALLAAATPGPWTHHVSGDGVYVNSGTFGVTFGQYRAGCGEADAALIVALRNEAEGLLDRLDTLEAEHEALLDVEIALREHD